MVQPTDYRQMLLDTIANALTSAPNPEVRAKAAESLGKLGVKPDLTVSLAIGLTMGLGLSDRRVHSCHR